ncbi:MAG: arylesterase [Kangiellaceae bacterium]|jgi:acyl-CoA thioesterase-1|nr:arylesterase [Kangiellaceae bacterium]
MKLNIWFSRILLTVITIYTSLATSQTLLILGDSLSASYNIPQESGWVSLLSNRLDKEYPTIKVMNASIAGETTRNALKRLPAIIEKHKPSYVIIELGGNDGLRGFDLKSVKNNLKKMIELSQQSGAKVLLTGIHIPPNYGKAYTELFYRTYLQLSKEYNTGFVPFILEGIGGNAKLMQGDGIHPKADAQPLVLDNMWPHIDKMLSKN